MAIRTCLDCTRILPDNATERDFTVNYGMDSAGNTICVACCGERDRKHMIETGRIALYLTYVGTRQIPEITNWPGTLKFDVPRIRKGKHNIARTRYDAWFIGPDGKTWWGVQYGENTEIIHCRRLKR